MDATHIVIKNVFDQVPDQRLMAILCCHGIGGKLFKEEESMIGLNNGNISEQNDAGTTFNQHLGRAMNSEICNLVDKFSVDNQCHLPSIPMTSITRISKTRLSRPKVSRPSSV